MIRVQNLVLILMMGLKKTKELVRKHQLYYKMEIKLDLVYFKTPGCKLILCLKVTYFICKIFEVKILLFTMEKEISYIHIMT